MKAGKYHTNYIQAFIKSWKRHYPRSILNQST